MRRFIKYILVIGFMGCLHVEGQENDYDRTIDKMVAKAMKKKRLVLPDKLDDSTACTFEFSKKPDALVLACFKKIRGKLTTEYHYYYKDSMLVRLSFSEFDFNARTAEFRDYYFSNRQFLAKLSYPDTDAKTVEELLTNADRLYKRAIELRALQD